MQRLYEKSELLFALVWIGIYIVGTSGADRLSESVGVEKCLTFPFLLSLCGFALVWVRRNGSFRKYGLCKTEVRASRFFCYLPLVVLASCNLWQGVRINLSFAETALYIGSMLCVGFLEELIFRGFLFKAMNQDNVTSAMIVSSITFGVGHIVNLVNGSGMSLISNLCQVCSAVAVGFLFVILFHRGGSLIPCIVTHGVLNALSAFANQANETVRTQIMTSVVITLLATGYTLALLKRLPEKDKKSEEL